MGQLSEYDPEDVELMLGTRKKLKLIRNAARCRKCGDIVESRHRHDWRSCSCGAMFVDGGLEYQRRGGDLENIEEMSEFQEV